MVMTQKCIKSIMFFGFIFKEIDGELCIGVACSCIDSCSTFLQSFFYFP